MAQQQDGVYVQGEFSEPMTAQHNFARHFDLDHPLEAMSQYNKIMHEHTRQQLESFTAKSGRRSDRSGHPSFSSEESSVESVSSTES